jgi:hypothetical protein
MKRLLSVVLLSLAPLLLFPSLACHKSATVAPVPGAVNTFDSTMYRALMDAQAAITSFKADVASGKLTLSATGKATLNQVITDYDAANALWQTYHASNGTTAPAPVQAAITTLQTDVQKLAITN